MKGRLASAFGRAETRASASAFIEGLLSGVTRKTGWQLAEQAGLARPYRMQSFIGRGSWSAEVLRDKVREEVISTLGDPNGVLVVEETGFLKKDTHYLGVARQYSSTARRIENCRVGVFLAYASPLGHALIDRRLYLPGTWAADGVRRREAHVPEKVTFATKLQIAGELISAALDARAPCARGCWPTLCMDQIPNYAGCLRIALQPYVLVVRSKLHLRFVTRKGVIQTDPALLADELATDTWRAHAAGEGTKGIRLNDWARIALPWMVDDGFERWILIRHNRNNPEERVYYLVFSRTGTTLSELAGAAGLRWTIGECFQRAKEELGSRGAEMQL